MIGTKKCWKVKSNNGAARLSVETMMIQSIE